MSGRSHSRRTPTFESTGNVPDSYDAVANF